MTLTAIFASVAVAHFLALLSPGPDFFLLVKSALRNKRRNAMGLALGIALANAIYIVLCLVGVAAVLATSLVLMSILKFAGAAFLLYLALAAFNAKKENYAVVLKPFAIGEQEAPSFSRELLTGLFSGLLNPKNPLFYLSLFSILLSAEVNFDFKLILGVWMSAVVLLWDGFIVIVLSHRKVRVQFQKIAFYVDKVSAIALAGLGCTIFLEALKSIKERITAEAL